MTDIPESKDPKFGTAADEIKKRMKFKDNSSSSEAGNNTPSSSSGSVDNTPSSSSSNVETVASGGNSSGRISKFNNAVSSGGSKIMQPKQPNNIIRSNNHSSTRKTIFAIIFFLASIFLFRDITNVSIELYQTIKDYISNGSFDIQQIYRVVILGLGILYGFMLFIPQIVSNNLLSPLVSFSGIIADCIDSIQDYKNKGDAKRDYALIMFIILICLTVTVALIHYIYASAFLAENSSIITVISKIVVIYVGLFYMGFFTKIIDDKFKNKTTGMDVKLKNVMFNSIIFIIGSIVVIVLGENLSNTFQGGIENINNEYSIFEE